MSAPWHSALRAVHLVHRDTPSEWERCRAAEDCTGIALPEADRSCFAHTGPNDRKSALARMRKDRAYDLRGTTFDQDLLATLPILLTDREIEQMDRDDRFMPIEVDFRSCRFTGPIDLSHRTFPIGRTDFSDTVFHSTATFTKTRFAGTAVFESTRFHEAATFDQARFDRPVWFLRTTFDDAAFFTDATFAADTYLHYVSASYLSFTGASYSGPAFMEPVQSTSTEFNGTTFTHRAVLQVFGSCTFDGARLNQGLELRVHSHADVFNALISMRRTHFGAPSTVSSSLDLPADFDDDTITSAEPAFHASGGLPHLLSLRDSDVTHLGLNDISLSQCLFAGAQNLDKLRLEGFTPFVRMPGRAARLGLAVPAWMERTGREALAEELLWRWQRTPAGSRRRKAWAHALKLDLPRGPSRRETVGAARLATLYRALRKGREDAKNEPGAGDFYYGEQQTRRLDPLNRPVERLLLTAYWALSGYGQRAGRALAALVVLVATVTALLVGFGLPDGTAVQRMTGTVQPAPSSGSPQQITLDTTAAPVNLPPVDQRWTGDRWNKALRIVAGSVARDTDQRLTAFGQWTLMIGRALGVLLVGLAALAIRGRLKR